MKIQADMHAVLGAEFHGLVDLFEWRLLELPPVAVDPDTVIERQPDKVEAPFGDEREVLLCIGFVAPLQVVFLQEIEPAPTRQPGCGAVGEAGACVGRRQEERAEREGAVAEKTAALHVASIERGSKH